MSFLVLAALGGICLVVSLLFEETLPRADRIQGGVLSSLSRLAVVGRNMGLLAPCLIFALSNLPFMGYIAVSSYIYVDSFGLSEQVYSYFFAANVLVSLAGPLIYMRFLSHTDKGKLSYFFFGISMISGLLLLVLWRFSPWAFLLCFMPYSFSGTIIRPFCTNFLLDQQKGDTGTASSLINFIFTICGSIGMLIVSGSGAGLVLSLGGYVFLIGLLQLLSWWGLLHSKIRCIGITCET